MAGTFEIERTEQKTPEEVARLAAALHTEPAPVLIEEEPETATEVEEETEFEAEQQPQTQSGTQDQAGGAPSSKRRRRRRGGRGHSDRPQGQQAHSQPQQPRHSSGQPKVETVSAIEVSGDAIAAVVPIDTSGAEANVNVTSPQPGQPGASKRKRRRRRGKRGGGGQSSGAPDARHTEADSTYGATSNGHDRFGVPDEIDTTPREEPERRPAIERDDAEAPIAMPNAASSPVWSLTADQGEAVSPPREIVADPVRMAGPEKTPAPLSSQPAGPLKKGWWQRTFRTDS